MDVAALIVAIVALILTLVVTGFGILLQWSMFTATSEQVTRMGEQNAALGERLTNTLTEIREVTTHTRGTIDTTMRHVIDAALPKVFPSKAIAAATGEPEREAPRTMEEAAWKSWQHQRLVSTARAYSHVLPILRLPQAKPEGVTLDDMASAVVIKDSDTDEDVARILRVAHASTVVGVLTALDVVEFPGEKLALSQGIDVDSILADADKS